MKGKKSNLLHQAKELFFQRRQAIWVHWERCLPFSPIPASQSMSEHGAEEESLHYTPNALRILARCYRPSE